MAGSVVGMNSGRQSADGALPGTGDYGAEFRADLNRSGIDGKGFFIHNVTGVTNGTPSGVEMDDGTQYNLLLDGTLTYPLSDSPTAGVTPYYIGFDPKTGGTAPYDEILDDTRHKFWAPDTPAFGKPVEGRTLARWDMTFQARLYLVWKYEDNTVYALARDDWQVILRASIPPGGVLTIDAASVVSASPMVLSNADPAKMTTPIFNGNFSIR